MYEREITIGWSNYVIAEWNLLLGAIKDIT